MKLWFHTHALRMRVCVCVTMYNGVFTMGHRQRIWRNIVPVCYHRERSSYAMTPVSHTFEVKITAATTKVTKAVKLEGVWWGQRSGRGKIKNPGLA